MGRVTARRRVLRVRDGVASYRPDTLAAEEPMEIRVGGRPLAVTMRTPGDDFDLAAGFLVSEGVLHAAGEVAGIRYCAGATSDGGNTYNVVDVVLARGVAARTPRWSGTSPPPPPAGCAARRVWRRSAPR
ncbi:FdhD-like protein [Streptomyces albidoflavus]|nr:FdhD-like protein [Streptomyces albidoflavus]